MNVDAFRQIQWNKPRDIAAGAVAVTCTALNWGVLGPLAIVSSLVGPALKKLAVSEDSSKARKFWLGVAALVLGGPGGLVSYLAAAPGARSDADLVAARAKVVDRHFADVEAPAPRPRADAPLSRYSRPSVGGGADSPPISSAPTRLSAPVTPAAPPAAGKTGEQAFIELKGTFAPLMSNTKAWTIAEKDGPEFAKWLGQTVRIVKVEREAIKAKIDELYGKLSKAEAAEFCRLASEYVDGLTGSAYEKEKVFADIGRHLRTGAEKV